MTEKKGIRFRGHETFTLREGWLNKGLMEVEKNPRLFSENFGADALGVGPNMAKAIRYWLKCAGLTTEIPQKGTELTAVGKTILKKDPYIEDCFTLWLIHCRITANYGQATAWNLFFNRFSYEEFDKSELVREMKEMVSFLTGEISPEKKVAEKSVEEDCDAILHMYVKKEDKSVTPEEKNSSPFAKLGLIKIMEGKYSRRQPDLNRLPEEILLYLLTDCIGEKKSMNMDELLTVFNGPGKLLQLRRNGLMELLEKLEIKEYIIINRTAGLNMVYLAEKMTAAGVVEAYYRG